VARHRLRALDGSSWIALQNGFARISCDIAVFRDNMNVGMRARERGKQPAPHALSPDRSGSAARGRSPRGIEMATMHVDGDECSGAPDRWKP